MTRPNGTPVRTRSGGYILTRVALAVIAADVAILGAALIGSAQLDPCHYAGQSTETAIFVSMVAVIAVASAAAIAFVRRVTGSWRISMLLLAVQLATGTGLAFVPFVARLAPAGCAG
ncbi:MAG TPA: hypothetical protein VNY76_02315 [Candidatus Acidoferrales bacterium]|nr:hypothetical protein [Candidatus Acidoferrales bacterium]